MISNGVRGQVGTRELNYRGFVLEAREILLPHHYPIAAMEL